MDPLLSDIDGLKCSASKLVAEGNENAINILGEVNNHWAVFKLKVSCLSFLLLTFTWSDFVDFFTRYRYDILSF